MVIGADVWWFPNRRSQNQTMSGIPTQRAFVEPTRVEDPIILEGRLRALVRSFASLDAVNLLELFESRLRFMRSVPHSHESRFPRDFGRSGGQQRSQDSERLEVALGARPPRGGTVPRKKLEGRLKQFQEGDWLSFLSQSSASS